MDKELNQISKTPTFAKRVYIFFPMNSLQFKLRTKGINGIRAPYYTPMGKLYFEDILGTMGEHVNPLKFSGGSFSLMSRERLIEITVLSDKHGVLVSTGGFIEYILTREV